MAKPGKTYTIHYILRGSSLYNVKIINDTKAVIFNVKGASIDQLRELLIVKMPNHRIWSAIVGQRNCGVNDGYKITGEFLYDVKNDKIIATGPLSGNS